MIYDHEQLHLLPTIWIDNLWIQFLWELACICSQEFTAMLKLAYFCILKLFLYGCYVQKVETSTQNPKIAESVCFTHFPSQILTV